MTIGINDLIHIHNRIVGKIVVGDDGYDEASELALDAIGATGIASKDQLGVIRTLYAVRKEKVEDWKKSFSRALTIPHHTNDIADDLVTKIVTAAEVRRAMPIKETPVPAKETPKSADLPTIPAEKAEMIDTLLNLSSGGKLPGINVLISTVEELRTKLEAAEKRTVRAEPAAPKTGGIPAGKVTWMPAEDVFGIAHDYLSNLEVPVFEWEAEHPLVPAVEHHLFEPVPLMRLLRALTLNRPLWLMGHSGTGKTTFVTQVAARLNWPVMRVNFDSEISRLDLVGRETLLNEGGVTVSKFVEGALPFAMQHDCIMICDEFDFIRPDVAYVMQRVLEGSGLLLAEDGGRMVSPSPYFRLVATANTTGKGDESGIYQGARVLSSATLDRFTDFVRIDYLAPDQEMALIRHRVPEVSAEAVERLVRFAGEIRKAFEMGEALETISPRGLIAAAEDIAAFTKVMSIKEAYGLVAQGFAGRANPSEAPRIMEIAQRIFD